MSIAYRDSDEAEIEPDDWARLRLGDTADDLRRAGGYSHRDAQGSTYLPDGRTVPAHVVWQPGARGLDSDVLDVLLPSPILDAGPLRSDPPRLSDPPRFLARARRFDDNGR
ncbi:hypothetical protein, partial [Rubrivirga sp.]|uniref:hypothetical protein n=1 Tax=Rubrivirga sp. TaxID=1885344 RepID=UPI003C7843DB